MKTQIRMAGLIQESIVDGPGIRMVLFTQGCPHHCPGCHNPHTHSFEGGSFTSVEAILKQLRKNPLLDGITLSGGEPFAQAGALAELAQAVHAMGLHVMTYTGYTYEEILDSSRKREDWKQLLEETDVLVDGRFVLEQKNLMLRFRGSENQRIIDVPESLAQGRVVLEEALMEDLAYV